MIKTLMRGLMNPKMLLQEAQLRATRQRVALLAVLAKRHTASVEELVKMSRGAFDMTTAYRMLEIFSEKGLVERVSLSGDRALYELTGSHHHHAVCTRCGVIADVSACIPPALMIRMKKAAQFARIDKHALEFFGICTPCAKRR